MLRWVSPFKGKHFLLQTENDNLLSLNNTCLTRPSSYLHPVELLDRIGIALGVLQLEGVPLGLLHKGGGRPDEQHEHDSAHCDLLQVEKRPNIQYGDDEGEWGKF